MSDYSLVPVDYQPDFSDDVRAALCGGEPRQSALSGTKGLLLAVLEDGIRSYLSPVQEVRAEAEYWVSSRRAPVRNGA